MYSFLWPDSVDLLSRRLKRLQINLATKTVYQKANPKLGHLRTDAEDADKSAAANFITALKSTVYFLSTLNCMLQGWFL